MKIKLLVLTLVLLIAIPPISADTIIINSADWRDVYSATLYGNLKSISNSFLVSDKHSLLILGSIPKTTPVQALSSKKSPFVIGYKSILEGQGYTAEEQVFDSFNLELAKLTDTKSFMIIDDSYGYNAISVAPYAVASESYVLFADKNTIRAVDSFLSDRDPSKIIIYGYTDREVRDTLAKYNLEIINKDGDRFANNIEIVKKYQAINPSKQAVLTNGEFIEKEIMSGAEPVVFIGSNNVPDIVKTYIQGSDIDIGVLVGNELVGTATDIRRQIGISVFVKFAQGARQPQGAISQVEALDMFYLPRYILNIKIDSIKYNKATGTLEVSIRNTEDQAVYLKGTYTVQASDGSSQTVGDVDPIFLDGNELRTFTYNVENIPEGSITGNAYVIYGESKNSLEKVLRETFDIEAIEVMDNCQLSIKKVTYDRSGNTFLVDLENKGSVACYADIELVDVIIDGATTIVSSEEAIEILSGKSGRSKIKAELSDEDIDDNPKIRVRAYYGERKTSLIKITEAELDLLIKSVDYVFYSLIPIIIILMILIILKRRKKKEQSYF